MQEIKTKLYSTAIMKLREIAASHGGNHDKIVNNAIALYAIMLREQRAGVNVILEGKVNIATEKHLREIGFDNIRVKRYCNQKIEHKENFR